MVCGSVALLVLVSVVIAVGVVIAMRACRKQPPHHFLIPKDDEESPPNSPLPTYTFTNSPCIATPTAPPICTRPIRQPWHRVVVIMSNHLPETDIQIVYAFIKAGLEERDIVVDIYDAGAAGCGPSLWLNRALRNCSKIICVCNRQFIEEWDGQNTEGSPVHALGILVTSHINKGGYPTELFMVTVLREGDKQFVPYYLASAVPYRIEQTDDIYRAITGESKYQ